MKRTIEKIADFVNFRILKKDPVYSQVQRGQECLYQDQFIKALNSIDIHNLTSYRMEKQSHDKEKARADYELVDNIFKEAVNKYGLLPGVLQIMFEQYVLADTWMREADKNKWIFRVMNRKEIDYFPDAARVWHILFK